MRRALTALCVALSVTAAGAVSTLNEERYCVASAMVVRDAGGKIARSRAVIAAFRARHACPSTKLLTGACPGWAIDHVIPLECGGCDSVSNMQWLPNQIKSAAGTLAKDRWERSVYCGG